MSLAASGEAAAAELKPARGVKAAPVFEASFADGTQRVTSGSIPGLTTAFTPSTADHQTEKPAPGDPQSPGFLIFSSDSQGPTFNAPELSDGRAGTISLWFRPENWDNKQMQGFNQRPPRLPLVTLMTRTAGSNRHFPPLLTVSAIPQQLRDRPLAIALNRETWRHLVVAWVPDQNTGIYKTSTDDLRVYLDGKRLEARASTFGDTLHVVRGDPGPDPQVTQLVIGRTSLRRNNENIDRTAARRFQLYERALTDDEVANLYRVQSGHAQQVQPLPDVEIHGQLNPALQRLDLQSQLLVDVKAAAMTWRLMLADETGAQREIVASDPLPVMHGWAGEQHDKLPIEWGKQYKLLLAWHDSQGQAVFEHAADVACPPAPPWLNSSLSEHPGEALPGFDPVRTNQQGEVILWNRRIRFAPSGMPEQILAAEKQLLARPVELILQTSNGPVKLSPQGKARLLSQDDEQATIEGVLAGEGWRVVTRSRTEFDGMIKFTMRIEPPQGSDGQVSALSLVIPTKAETSSLYSLATGRGFGFRGGNAHEQLPQDNGVFFTSHDHPYLRGREHRGSFIPFFMFTDGQRGLAWFCESDKGWTVEEKTSAVKARRTDDQAVLELDIIRQPTDFAEPVEYVFGLHVLPIRKMADDHRAFRKSLGTVAVDAFMPPSFRTEKHRADKNALWPHDGWEAAIARLAKRDKTIADYSQRTQRPFEGSLYYLSRPWPGLPDEAMLFQPKWYLPGFIQHTPAYIDCFIYWSRQWLERTDIRGFYIDDIWPPPMTDPLEGPAYYLPDGSVQAGYDFFNQRELLKRLRWAFHDTGRKPVIWIHSTQTLYPNLLGFADAFYDGEMQGIDKGDRFGQRWPLHRLKFDRGVLWGSTPVFMNIYKTDNKLDRDQDLRSFIGEMFLQDIGFSHAYPFLRAHADMFTWRSDALTFVAYDDAQPLASSKNESVHVSAYIQGPRSDPSQVYLVVVNRSDEAVVAEVDLTKALTPAGGSPLRDIDTWSNERMGDDAGKQGQPRLDGNTLRVDIRPWDFRLIQWQRQ